MKKLFTPLFTTKAKGTGLGLAVCKRIIDAHNGSISVESVENEGTTFKILIPDGDEAPPEDHPEEPIEGETLASEPETVNA